MHLEIEHVNDRESNVIQYIIFYFKIVYQFHTSLLVELRKLNTSGLVHGQVR